MAAENPFFPNCLTAFIATNMQQTYSEKEMQIIRETVAEARYGPPRFTNYFQNMKIAVADIETTGLAPNCCNVILGGLAALNSQDLSVRQYFSETKAEEQDILSAYCRDLEQFDLIITYNGNHFDLPFLQKRLALHHLAPMTSSLGTLDLYRCCRYFSPLKELLPDLKQKTVEWYLGFRENRTDEISGAESVKLYEEYCLRGGQHRKDAILLHNRDDLIQLSRLLQILNRMDLHRILFHEGFPVVAQEKRALVKKIRLNDENLTIKGFTHGWQTDHYTFEGGYQFYHQANEQTFCLKIPLQTMKGYCFADLEKLPFSCDSLESAAGYASGYLILTGEERTWYHEINSLTRLIIMEILKGIE